MSVLKEIAEKEEKLEMTPMIDVTFLLLIFFMCTIKFKTLEGKLSAYLPKDVGVNASDAEPVEKVDIVIEILKEGRRVDPRDGKPWDGSTPRFTYADREVEYRVGPQKFRDVDELRKRLKKLHEAEPERPATLKPLPGSVYADVVTALDAAIQAEFKEITFAGSFGKKKK